VPGHTNTLLQAMHFKVTLSSARLRKSLSPTRLLDTTGKGRL